MYNYEKIKKLKKVSIFLGAFFLFFLGITLGNSVSNSKHAKEQKKIEEVHVEKEEKQVDERMVQEFLVAYYTKKELSENRNRYEPLVTVQMYNELVSMEEDPVNQAYKGYISDQVLDRSDIYVNESDQTAICTVNYKNTQRMKKYSDEGALKNQNNQESIKLTFQEQGNSFLVNKLEYITLESSNYTTKNSYNNFVHSWSSTEEEERTDSSDEPSLTPATRERSHSDE